MSEQNHSGSGHNIKALGNVYLSSLPKLNSDLSSIVNALGKRLFFPDELDTSNPAPFNPEVKITYNNVVKFKAVIDNYKFYLGKLSAIYKEFDYQGTNKTHIVLENIKLTYIREKSKLLHDNPGKVELEIIREFSDDLILQIENTLLNEIRMSSNIETSSESVNICLQIVLIDAFVRCKILEEPI